jgi:hypothetical protein
MQISQEQIAGETRVDSTTSLVQDLKTNHGVKDPKIILVFDSNEGGPDAAEHPWKVHVFFNSPTELEEANLNVPTVLRDTKVWVEGEEVIKTTYPGGNIGFCTKIGGQPVWIT